MNGSLLVGSWLLLHSPGAGGGRRERSEERVTCRRSAAPSHWPVHVHDMYMLINGVTLQANNKQAMQCKAMLYCAVCDILCC
jgi:hypothetical protein